MITLTAKIDITSQKNNSLMLTTSNLVGNNVSCFLGNVVSRKKEYDNPFLVGLSKLGQGFRLVGSTKKETFTITNYTSGGNNGEYYIFSYAFTPDSKNVEVNDVKILNSIPLSAILFVDAYYSSGKIRIGIAIQPQFVPETINHLDVEVSYGGGTKPYFISETFSNGVGQFDKLPEIFISDTTKQANMLCIAFDTSNNKHPNSIKVDGKVYYDDDAIFVVPIEKSESHTITLNDWNAPNSPIIITGIYSNISIEIDGRNMISMSGSLFDRSDLKLPSFGIISNTGNIEFNDIDGEVGDYAEHGLLSAGLECEIKLNNTLVDGASKTVGVFKTDQWFYDNDNKKVSVSIKDDLEEWQNINVEPIFFNAETLEPKYLSDFYNYLWEKTNTKYKMQHISQLDEITFRRLHYIRIKYPLLKAGSLWSSWEKVCIAGQCHIYKENGVVKFRYSGGN